MPVCLSLGGKPNSMWAENPPLQRTPPSSLAPIQQVLITVSQGMRGLRGLAATLGLLKMFFFFLTMSWMNENLRRHDGCYLPLAPCEWVYPQSPSPAARSKEFSSSCFSKSVEQTLTNTLCSTGLSGPTNKKKPVMELHWWWYVSGLAGSWQKKSSTLTDSGFKSFFLNVVMNTIQGFMAW